MLVIKPFDKFPALGNSQLSFFLAGGSTNWRDTVEKTLECNEDFHSVALIDPFDTIDSGYEPFLNTAWEAKMARKADCIVFWFSKESECSISLFEFGYTIRDSTKPVIVGIEPGYSKEDELVAQISALRPDLYVVYSLTELIEEIERYVEVNNGADSSNQVYSPIRIGGTD